MNIDIRRATTKDIAEETYQSTAGLVCDGWTEEQWLEYAEEQSPYRKDYAAGAYRIAAYLLNTERRGLGPQQETE